MPVYICQAGSNSSEPWRHGLQVYAAPFALTDVPSGESPGGHDNIATAPHLVSTSNDHATLMENVINMGMNDDDNGNDNGNDNDNDTDNDNDNDNDNNDPQPQPQGERQVQQDANDARDATSVHHADGRSQMENNNENNINRDQHINIASLRFGLPVRRIRHAEVVLVDDVCIAYERHWLRLRWPGYKGGFAGYVALGKVNEAQFSRDAMKLLLRVPTSLSASGNEVEGVGTSAHQEDFITALRESQRGGQLQEGVEEEEEREGNEEDNEDGNREDELQDNASALSSEPYEATTAFCLRTGLEFPSSGYMKLMAIYDDGLSPAVSSSPLPSELIFCRICREGLHDDADDEQPSPTMENEGNEGKAEQGQPCPSGGSLSNEGDRKENIETATTKGPVQPHPMYHTNSHAAENPLISPCECSGSMAFVHYLCVEQWRCRSRHPKARRGLNCETCGKPYALPPPSARPVDNEDWLEAMPPHVIDALRQPHIWWQIGAAIVRRRWLRPIAPVLMSPIVALYCRARRLLKKKGVARRRWACSLCRRRARWKCVRCLRSYYCSRQCQNVSWHIVHKHVCYKPSRWFWSLLVYGVATLLAFPGILRDPLVYDLGFAFIPLSFYVMAILGGGIATALKKTIGWDLRGRTFEVGVILLTLSLVLVSWGLLGAFFGDSSRCYGVFGSQQLSEEDHFFQFLRRMQKSIIEPAKNWFLMWDRAASSSGAWPRKILCMPQQEVGCFEHLHKANSDFLFDEENGGRCSMDLILVSSLLQGAALVTAGNHYWKRRERQRRADRRPRPHQD